MPAQHLFRLSFFPALLVMALGLLLREQGCGEDRPLRIATYNIRQFPRDTDLPRLREVIAALDADVIAVQEIKDRAALDPLVRSLSTGRRRYRYVLAACGGKNQMFLGFLYDTRRAHLRSTREFAELDPDGKGRCSDGERSGLWGVFVSGKRVVHLLAVHLPAGGLPDRVRRRREQWRRALRLLQKLREKGATEVALLGDVNSIGYLDNRDGERDLIDDDLRRAGMDLPTRSLPCSFYWQAPESRDVLSPNLLDHVITTRGLARPGSARVHGFCAALRCQPHPMAGAPPEFHSVSDHCPVSIDL